MTTIKPADVKRGDLISIATTVKVEEVGTFQLAGPSATGELMRYTWQDLERVGRTITLLDRPLPEEPRVGYIVLDRSGEVWQRRNTLGTQAWAGLHSRYTTWEKLNAYHGPLEILPRVNA